MGALPAITAATATGIVACAGALAVTAGGTRMPSARSSFGCVLQQGMAAWIDAAAGLLQQIELQAGKTLAARKASIATINTRFCRPAEFTSAFCNMGTAGLHSDGDTLRRVFVAIWRFTTADPAEFERHYGPDGSWAQLFRRDDAYIRTDLLRDGTSYVTLDWWTSRAAYDAFRARHAADYASLDFFCEEVTTGEEKLGEFETAAD